jgi:tetratricopeptide (TPR) repeat protein
MKYLQICILLLVGLTRLFAASDSLQSVTLEENIDIDNLFSRAGAFYDGGDYENALELYREIIDSGHEAADLYYNMGNAAFRSNSIGYAVLYYEKTLKLDPSHEDAIYNMEYISRYMEDAFDKVPELFLRTWISSAVKMLPERTWSILALVSFVLTLIFILLYLFTKGLTLKKSGFFAALVGIILFIFAFSAAWSSHNIIIQPESGIIISPSVVVRSTPSNSGTELFILHEGARIEVNEEVTGWQNIRIIDGREGWIGDSDYKPI